MSGRLIFSASVYCDRRLRESYVYFPSPREGYKTVGKSAESSIEKIMAAEAATMAAEQQLNGLAEQHNGEFDPDAVVDEDDQKKLRPPDIDADVRDMERRRRVEVMMGSRTFRDDLERIVDQQLREGGAAGLFALQQHISDLTGMGTVFYFPHDRHLVA